MNLKHFVLRTKVCSVDYNEPKLTSIHSLLVILQFPQKACCFHLKTYKWAETDHRSMFWMLIQHAANGAKYCFEICQHYQYQKKTLTKIKARNRNKKITKDRLLLRLLIMLGGARARHSRVKCRYQHYIWIWFEFAVRNLLT